MTEPTPTWQTFVGAGLLTGQLNRWLELTGRDLTARSIAELTAAGAYDPDRHPAAADYPPLTVAEHLEVLAIGEALARHFRHPAHIHHAVAAGAAWAQIAAAVGRDEQTLRTGYRTWADGQHHLHHASGGRYGLSDGEHAAAIAKTVQTGETAGATVDTPAGGGS